MIVFSTSLHINATKGSHSLKEKGTNFMSSQTEPVKSLDSISHSSKQEDVSEH